MPKPDLPAQPNDWDLWEEVLVFRWVLWVAGTCPGTGTDRAGERDSIAFASSPGLDAPRMDNLNYQWEVS